MKNPLKKRLPREFKHDFVKYAVIFLFMIFSIAFVSGFLVAGNSMITAYNESFEKYNIENGHFVVSSQLSKDTINKIETDNVKVSVFEDFYVEQSTNVYDENKDRSVLRIFSIRDENNKVCVMKGELPKEKDEIAIDRMYADNNELKVGDTIECNEEKMKISGLVALSDYSALYSDVSDMMFDSKLFGVAVVTKECFDGFSEKDYKFSYGWFYDEEPKDDIEEKELSDDLMDIVVKNVYGQGMELEKYIPRYINSAINFAGEDLGKDSNMMIVVMFILVAILAFIFSVTIKHTIIQESGAIGTLRALGYTKLELLVHYMELPIIITLISAIIGNVLGYTLMKDIVADLYYSSYSLTTFNVLFNEKAFVITTVLPVTIMFIINLFTIIRALTHSPLQFLRYDLSKLKSTKTIKLSEYKFINRFRIRVILQSVSSYLIMWVGIIFASILLIFGLMMSPLLTKYEDDVIDNMFAEYQYILNSSVEIDGSDYEKFVINRMKYIVNDFEEEISVYGFIEDSKFLDVKLEKNSVVISNGFAEKYRLSEGDKFKLREGYGKKEYEFKVGGIYDYPASLSVFMSREMYCETFDFEKDYYNGIFSHSELKNLNPETILTTIQKTDLTKTSRQLEISMGEMFNMINVFSIVMYLLILYLLIKLVIEKNANSIAMVKILGYSNSEICQLYMVAITWVVLFSVLSSLWISTKIIGILYFELMKSFTGWLPIYISPMVYVKMTILGLVAYAFVAILQVRKIKKIPATQALKNVE